MESGGGLSGTGTSVDTPGSPSMVTEASCSIELAGETGSGANGESEHPHANAAMRTRTRLSTGTPTSVSQTASRGQRTDRIRAAQTRPLLCEGWVRAWPRPALPESVEGSLTGRRAHASAGVTTSAHVRCAMLARRPAQQGDKECILGDEVHQKRTRDETVTFVGSR